MGVIMLLVMGAVIGGVCGWSLYTAAQRDKRNPLIWGVFGFLTNIVGMAIYRVAVGPIMKP